MLSRRSTRAAIIVATVAVVLASGSVLARSPDSREGRWEGYAGGLFLMSESVDFKGGSSLETDDELGFAFGLGYNVSQHLLLTGEISWNSVDYDGLLASADDPPGSPSSIAGELDLGSFSGIATWHFIDGPITPYVSATLGWTWVDSNIADGPPQLGCWWDPWYGYICTSVTDTKSDSSMSYGFGAGVRWDFSYGGFARLGYDQRWVDFDNASGSPSFGAVRIEIGGKF